MQFFVPLVLAAGLVYGGLMWLPLILAAAVCAYLFMNNLAVAKTPFKAQFATVKRAHTWIMSFLYIGTFGSFLGYSAAFPLVLKLQFPEAPGVEGGHHRDDHAGLHRPADRLADPPGRRLAVRQVRRGPGHRRSASC